MNRIVPPLLLALALGLGGHAAVAAPPAALIGGYADAARYHTELMELFDR